jgi:hypothetical protein
VGGLPDPNNFSSQSWNYFVTWGDFIQKNNSVEYVPRVYNDPRVITLEKLPNLKTYLGEVKPGNIAYNKTVTVSSTETGSVNVAARAVDGRSSTRWSSAYTDPQWIQVDLGANYSINRVALLWEAAYARAYRIEVSSNGTSWTTIYQTTTGDGGTDDISSLSSIGRYVRIYGTQRATTWGYSLYEIEVYGTKENMPPVANAGADITAKDTDLNGLHTVSLNGTLSSDEDGTITTYRWTLSGNVIATSANASVVLPVGTHEIQLEVTDNSGAKSTDMVRVIIQAGDIIISPPIRTNLALNKTVTVSSTESGFGNIASFAVDGNRTTRWSSVYADPQWIQVDLGSSYQISEVQLFWEIAHARAYRVEVSSNGSSWTSVYQTTTGDGGTDQITGLTANGRYVRIVGTQRATAWGYSLFELEVYGSPSTVLSMEAEAAQLTGVTTSTAVAGFSGSGFVQGFDAATDKLVFPMQITQAGTYDLQIRYQTPWGVKRNFVYVNNSLVGEIEFPASTAWSTVNVSGLNLITGLNTIEIRNSWGWFYVDRIDLTAVALLSSTIANVNTSSFTISAFPNPASDVLQVSLTPTATQNVVAQILNVDGTIVRSITFTPDQVVLFDLNGLNTGLYIVQITQGSIRQTTLIQKL